jgi:SNF2 family DNA or RNA helicase
MEHHLTATLFPHQKHNVERMKKLEESKEFVVNERTIVYTPMAVLGDKPGTGKTLTMVALLCHPAKWWNGEKLVQTVVRASNFTGNVFIQEKLKFDKLNIDLVVCGASIIAQWEMELKKSNLRIFVIDTRAKANRTDWDDIDVVICNTTMYNAFVANISDKAVRRLIYDEVDSAYIIKMSSITFGFCWLISATSCAFMKEVNYSRNHFLKDCFRINSFTLTSAQFMEAITIRAPDNLIQEVEVKIPEAREIKHTVSDALIVRQLGDFLDDQIKSLLTAGNIEEAVKLLGGSSTNDTITQLLVGKVEREITEAEMKITLYSRYNEQQTNSWKKKKTDLEEKKNKLLERIKYITTKECPICLDEIKHPVMLPTCQNVCCAECIITHTKIRDECPFCREKAIKSKLTYLGGYAQPSVPVKASPSSKKKKLNTKLDVIDKVLEKPNVRLLIFATDITHFKVIQKYLKSKDIKCAHIKGTHVTREKGLSSYTNGDVQVLLLNARVNGAGVNLQVTTDVIVYNIVEESIFKQIVGRARRIGLDHEVTVHTFHDTIGDIPPPMTVAQRRAQNAGN